MAASDERVIILESSPSTARSRVKHGAQSSRKGLFGVIRLAIIELMFDS
jgi:hypothetical protein